MPPLVAPYDEAEIALAGPEPHDPGFDGPPLREVGADPNEVGFARGQPHLTRKSDLSPLRPSLPDQAAFRIGDTDLVEQTWSDFLPAELDARDPHEGTLARSQELRRRDGRRGAAHRSGRRFRRGRAGHRRNEGRPSGGSGGRDQSRGTRREPHPKGRPDREDAGCGRDRSPSPDRPIPARWRTDGKASRLRQQPLPDFGRHLCLLQPQEGRHLGGTGPASGQVHLDGPIVCGAQSTVGKGRQPSLAWTTPRGRGRSCL